MDQDARRLDADAYAEEVCRQIGAEVRERRAALGLSAYALAKSAKVSDQTILNIEQGHARPLVVTLARIAHRFGIEISDLAQAAARRPS